MSQTHQNEPSSADVSLPAVEGGTAEVGGSRWGKAHHVMLIFAGVVLLAWLGSGFYTVRSDEVAIVERLGEYVGSASGEVEKVPPGTHLGYPWPIDVVHKVRVNQTIQLEINDFYASAANDEFKKKYLLQGVPREVLESIFDPYLITADKNVVKAKMQVQYQVKDPVKYLRSVSHVEEAKGEEHARQRAITQVATHVLIREMGRTRVDAALLEGRQELMQRVTMTLTRDLPSANAQTQPTGGERSSAESMHVPLDLGIQVESVLVEVTWPSQVDIPFKMAQSAKFGRDERVRQAQATASSVLTLAQSEADPGDPATGHLPGSIIREAEAYRMNIVQEARGEATRFNEIFNRYGTLQDDKARAGAREITRASLYADAVRDMLDKAIQVSYVPLGQKRTIILAPPKDIVKTQPPG